MLISIDDLRTQVTKGQEWIIDNCIFLTRAGSHLYGTAHEGSDTDYVGVTVAPLDYWVGTKVFEQFQWKDEETNSEGTIYDIRKFLKLASGSNPNIIEILFVPPGSEHVIKETTLWGNIVKSRLDLVSQKAFHTFGGYAHSQLHKLVVKQSKKTGRQGITEEFGYDVKFAMHCKRLTEEGIELLTTGNIIFPRPNAGLLLDIRQGKAWGPEQLDDCISDLTAQIERLEELRVDVEDGEVECPLDYRSDPEWLNRSLIGIFRAYVDMSKFM